MARRRKALAGRDIFAIVGHSPLIEKEAAPHALTVAQRIAEKAGEPLILTVERQSLFGPKVSIYRVTRTEDGDVYTRTLSPED